MPHDDIDSADALVPQEEMSPSLGAFCFLDRDRMCTAECMAYVTHPRHKSSSSDLSEEQSHCALLAGLERTGRGVIALAGTVGQATRKKGIEDADRRRSEQFNRVPDQATRSPFGKAQ